MRVCACLYVYVCVCVYMWCLCVCVCVLHSPRPHTLFAVSSRRVSQILALFSRLWYTLGGGVLAAGGVLGMHYLGMMAQRTNATQRFDGGVVFGSAVVAFVAASAAFWILFRAVRHGRALRSQSITAITVTFWSRCYS